MAAAAGEAGGGTALELSIARLDTLDLSREWREELVSAVVAALKLLYLRIQEDPRDSGPLTGNRSGRTLSRCLCVCAFLIQHIYTGTVVWKDSIIARYQEASQSMSRVAAAAHMRPHVWQETEEDLDATSPPPLASPPVSQVSFKKSHTFSKV